MFFYLVVPSPTTEAGPGRLHPYRALPTPPPDVVGLDPEPLHALAYVSTPTEPFSDRDLSDLLLSARSWNAAHGVTGKLLVLEDDAGHVVQFAQWLEGAPDVLAACLDRIHADPRHQLGDVREHGAVGGRRFPGWDMAFESATDVAFGARAQALQTP